MNRSGVRCAAMVALAALAVASCVSRSALPTSTPTEKVGLASDACAAPATPTEADPRLPARPTPLLGGGMAKSGDFVFDMWLYCDEELGPTGQGAMYSEVFGLGIHLVWLYEGPRLDSPVEYSFGIGELAISGGGDGGPLTPGSSASFTGGVHSQNGALARITESGNLVKITTQVRAGSVIESATFSFAFQKGLSGLKLGAIAVEPGP